MLTSERSSLLFIGERMLSDAFPGKEPEPFDEKPSGFKLGSPCSPVQTGTEAENTFSLSLAGKVSNDERRGNPRMGRHKQVCSGARNAGFAQGMTVSSGLYPRTQVDPFVFI